MSGGSRKRFYWLYGVLVLGVIAWWLSRESTSVQQVIEGRLDRVAELVSKESDESALESAERARRLGEMFDQEMLIELRPLGMEIRSVGELVRPFVGLRSQTGRLTVTFATEDFTAGVEFPTATWIGKATVVGQGGTLNGREVFRLEVEWKKVRGDWLIETLIVTERLDGPGVF